MCYRVRVFCHKDRQRPKRLWHTLSVISSFAELSLGLAEKRFDFPSSMSTMVVRKCSISPQPLGDYFRFADMFGMFGIPPTSRTRTIREAGHLIFLPQESTESFIRRLVGRSQTAGHTTLSRHRTSVGCFAPRIPHQAANHVHVPVARITLWSTCMYSVTRGRTIESGYLYAQVRHTIANSGASG